MIYSGGTWPYPDIFCPQMMPLWYVSAFLVGTCVGSFLNVCIWRIPRNESIVTPPSHCPRCGHILSWYENIPYFSWIFLRGRCRACGEPVSFRYFLVELLCAMMFLIAWHKVVTDRQPLLASVLYFAVIILLICTFFIDLEHRIIPNEISYPAIVFGLVFAVLFPEVWGTSSHLKAFLRSVMGFLAGGGVFALFAVAGKMIFKREALGWGDVKYLAAVGACLGLGACFFTVLFGSLAASLFGLVLIVFRRKKFRSFLSFGPYLAVGTWIWMIYGQRILIFYLNWIESLRQ